MSFLGQPSGGTLIVGAFAPRLHGGHLRSQVQSGAWIPHMHTRSTLRQTDPKRTPCRVRIRSSEAFLLRAGSLATKLPAGYAGKGLPARCRLHSERYPNLLRAGSSCDSRHGSAVSCQRQAGFAAIPQPATCRLSCYVQVFLRQQASQ